MKSTGILVFAIFALAIILAVLFSGCIRQEEPSGELSMTDIDKKASEITENVNLNDPTVSISTKLLADDPSKEIELESVDVTTIQYVYNFSVTADRTMDDTLVVVGKDTSGEIVYNKTEQIHLEATETQFFLVYIPVHKSDGQIIEDLTLTFKTLDEEIREVKTRIKTDKKPYAVSDKLKKTFASFDSDKDGKLSESERHAWWDWVEENVEYMTDKFDDYTKMPDETVYEEGGDCEDMAVLNAEFYKSYGYEVQIGIVATEGSDGYNHALTRVKIGDEWVIVDNAAGSELGDTIKVQEEPHRVDYSLELFFRATVHPIKVRNIDGNVNGYDIDEDGKADIVTRDSDGDGVADIYEFYKDGKKIQERHFEDGELIKTNYYDKDGNLISREMPEPKVSPKVTVKPTHTPTVTPTPHVSEEKVKDIYEFLEGAERVQKAIRDRSDALSQVYKEHPILTSFEYPGTTGEQFYQSSIEHYRARIAVYRGGVPSERGFEKYSSCLSTRDSYRIKYLQASIATCEKGLEADRVSNAPDYFTNPERPKELSRLNDEHEELMRAERRVKRELEKLPGCSSPYLSLSNPERVIEKYYSDSYTDEEMKQACKLWREQHQS